MYYMQYKLLAKISMLVVLIARDGIVVTHESMSNIYGILENSISKFLKCVSVIISLILINYVCFLRI